MIPTKINTQYINDVVDNTNIPLTSETYYINFEKNEIQGKINGLDAVAQAIYMILNIEKQSYTIYPLDFGVNLEKYIGQPHDYVIADIEREIKEALIKDSRILDVKDFEYTINKEHLLVKFIVLTVYGEVSEEVVV